MIALGLRRVQEALNQKADEVQREFIQLSTQLDEINRKMLEVRQEERAALRAEQEAIRARQQKLADEVNLWRERGRSVLTRPGADALRNYLQTLLDLGEERLVPAVQHALYLLDASEEELERLSQLESGQRSRATSPVARLVERARSEYDMRGSDSTARQRAAVEFANRSGMAQDDAVLAEIEAALDDPDPLVREVLLLTLIQIHRFRCMRVADLDMAHKAAQRLAEINHATVIPVLIEILEKPRSGFVEGPAGPEEKDNGPSRLIALLRLVEWHTAEAQAAVRARLFDRDPHIVNAAKRALELFPDPWTGPVKGAEKG